MFNVEEYIYSMIERVVQRLIVLMCDEVCVDKRKTDSSESIAHFKDTKQSYSRKKLQMKM